jgi:large subunit ribosomal protein L17
MRHQLKGKKLNRTSSHRKATLRALAIALIKNERIVTTSVKAKELRRVIEPLITRAKEDSMHNRREVFSFLQDNDSTNKLFNEVGPKSESRPGGYCRVIKLGTRKGDGTEVSVIELVDYNDVRPDGASTKKKKTRRGGVKAKTEDTSTPAPKAKAAKKAAVVEDVEEINPITEESQADAEEATTHTESAVEAVETTETTEQAPEAPSADESSEEEKKA